MERGTFTPSPPVHDELGPRRPGWPSRPGASAALPWAAALRMYWSAPALPVAVAAVFTAVVPPAAASAAASSAPAMITAFVPPACRSRTQWARAARAPGRAAPTRGACVHSTRARIGCYRCSSWGGRVRRGSILYHFGASSSGLCVASSAPAAPAALAAPGAAGVFRASGMQPQHAGRAAAAHRQRCSFKDELWRRGLLVLFVLDFFAPPQC